MPHCIIEYSQDVIEQVLPQQLLAQVTEGAVNSALFDKEHIKVRAIGFDYAQTGTGNKGFIHVTARILSGRTLAQRQMLSASILKTLQNMSLQELSVTVEIIEMERDSYSKFVV